MQVCKIAPVLLQELVAPALHKSISCSLAPFTPHRLVIVIDGTGSSDPNVGKLGSQTHGGSGEQACQVQKQGGRRTVLRCRASERLSCGDAAGPPRHLAGKLSGRQAAGENCEEGTTFLANEKLLV